MAMKSHKHFTKFVQRELSGKSSGVKLEVESKDDSELELHGGEA